MNELLGWAGLVKINNAEFLVQTTQGPICKTSTFRTDHTGEGAYEGHAADKTVLDFSGTLMRRIGANPYATGINRLATVDFKYWPSLADAADPTKAYRVPYLVVTECGEHGIDAREGGQQFKFSGKSNGAFKVPGDA